MSEKQPDTPATVRFDREVFREMQIAAYIAYPDEARPSVRQYLTDLHLESGGTQLRGRKTVKKTTVKKTRRLR